MAEIFWGLLSIGLFSIGLCTLFGFLGGVWWAFDLFSHFRVQYLLLLSVLLVVFLAGGQYFQAITSAVLALLNLGMILPLYRKVPPHFRAVRSGTGSRNTKPSDMRVYRALSANVLQRNREYDRVRDLIQTADPDLIMLIEINQSWVAQLQPVLEKYPHSVEPLREDNYGLGLFSKFPFVSAKAVEFGEAKVPSVIARIDLDGQPLTVIGTHPPPPRKERLARLRNAQLREIAKTISDQSDPALLMGDLNISSWSYHFRKLLRLGRLKDSRQGWGLQPSWPVDRPAFLVPIDHILVTGGIAIHRRWRGPCIGSDHYPVLVDFSFSPCNHNTTEV